MPEPFTPPRLSDALTAPALWDPTLPEILASLASRLDALPVSRQPRRPFRIIDHTVRAALDPHGPGTDTPFVWSAITARRALGLSAVRHLVDGRARTPVEAVQMAVAEVTGRGLSGAGGAGGRPPEGPMGRWLVRLTDTARTAVTAETVTWATRLWVGLDWSVFTTPPTIGRDRWWDSPRTALLALRSRAEVRTVVPCAAAPGAPPDPGARSPEVASTHLVVLSGPRRPSARAELCLVALVEALLVPATAPPGRVIGWWPDSGHAIRVEVDRAALEEGVRAVAAALAGPGGATKAPRPAAAA
ncbi:MAG TPA: hypothetical protein VL961_02360 [Acidimicrobiales bacterium]|nr:hypothetical protein [Acidimicrobiales bacterium]